MNGATMDLLIAAVRQLLLFVHLLAFAFAIVAVLHEDVALLRARHIDAARLRATARHVAWLLGLLWLSGGALILLDPSVDGLALLAHPKLAAKLTVVGLLTANGVLLHRLAFPMLTEPRGSPRRAAQVCAALGAVSTVSWLYASFLGAARLIAPAMSYGGFLALYAAVIAVGLAVGLGLVRQRVERLLARSPAARLDSQPCGA